MICPPVQPEKGPLAKAWRAYNALRNFVYSLRPMPGHGIRVNHTPNGVTISVDLKPGKGGTGTTDFVARWG